ncbi:hypothetical protein M408DRAFT_334354 [Serendipita vermifera MAFF 305830]|uniref:Uncharacterized protein n=1 Tax=Serendipita vermifera MAFF 305830 TaxID=933852 RepID=A0A0C3AJR4_SERVB|nr:hypothetical protein M408DRAFT_334356 [Serendipita vermifera MAFF 305830]KIM19561.1 hypothetical protein M408DRAFT_334354 [Serendipita vermifera MAFF 305830]
MPTRAAAAVWTTTARIGTLRTKHAPASEVISKIIIRFTKKPAYFFRSTKRQRRKGVR